MRWEPAKQKKKTGFIAATVLNNNEAEAGVSSTKGP
uniref:Uncharacterized protein n=1 Tax=Arundo donax TaxID=35708 RepID=A0A0A9HP09_ARUDO